MELTTSKGCHVWNVIISILERESRFIFGLNATKTTDNIQKCFKQKWFRIQFLTKSSVYTYLYLPQECRWVLQKICRQKISKICIFFSKNQYFRGNQDAYLYALEKFVYVRIYPYVWQPWQPSNIVAWFLKNVTAFDRDKIGCKQKVVWNDLKLVCSNIYWTRGVVRVLH